MWFNVVESSHGEDRIRNPEQWTKWPKQSEVKSVFKGSESAGSYRISVILGGLEVFRLARSVLLIGFELSTIVDERNVQKAIGEEMTALS